MEHILRDKTVIQELQKTKHPDIYTDIIKEWQVMIDLMAKILEVPAGLIMRVDDDKLAVFVRSETKNNPYKAGDSNVWFDSGLYCETVMRSGKRLIVPNALEDEDWNTCPGVQHNMINYLGYPLKWSNGDIFGTICVLDIKNHYYSQDQEEIMLQLKKLIEMKLLFIEKNLPLEKAQSIVKLGSWSLDLTLNKLFWSNEIYNIFEIDKDKFDASYEFFLRNCSSG